jgi:hypothetical protein
MGFSARPPSVRACMCDSQLGRFSKFRSRINVHVSMLGIAMFFSALLWNLTPEKPVFDVSTYSPIFGSTTRAMNRHSDLRKCGLDLTKLRPSPKSPEMGIVKPRTQARRNYGEEKSTKGGKLPARAVSAWDREKSILKIPHL